MANFEPEQMTPLEKIARIQLDREEQTSFEKARKQLRKIFRALFDRDEEPESDYSRAMEEYDEHEPGV